MGAALALPSDERAGGDDEAHRVREQRREERLGDLGQVRQPDGLAHDRVVQVNPL